MTEKPSPIRLPTPPVEEKESAPAYNSLTLIFTAAVFFGIGFLLASLINGGNTNDSGDDTGRIRSAIQGTLIALTPPSTAVPTRVPREVILNSNNPSLGPEDAPVTLVEFSDYLCPYCARFHAYIRKPLLDHYGDLVRYVFRDYPVIGLQQSAEIAASAQCAGLQGKFWEYSDLLWQNQSPETPTRLNLDTNALLLFAEQTDLDIDTFNQCLANEEGMQRVIADLRTGSDFNLTGTPAFFIEGERIEGLASLETFFALIDAELLRQGITPPARDTES